MGTISTLVDSLRLGDPLTDGGLTVVPVFGRFEGVPQFITLEEALAAQWLLVTEVSEGGAVPMLKARNSGPLGVLILDGEELAGAKQNRVLNTSVYIAPEQEVIIPVSCTEAGRWRYRSASFNDSGYVAAPAIRLAAVESVTDSLRLRRGYQSDQSRVWDEVSRLQQRHNSRSATSAARDVYEKRKQATQRREAAFACVPGQTGLLALWSGRVAGLDVVASDKAYTRLHPRLIRSYALDAPRGSRSSIQHDLALAQEWLDGLAQVEETQHESPGNGVSYRFTGSGVVGSALAVEGAVLHAVAFATGSTSDSDAESGSAPGIGRYHGFYERRSQFPW